MPKKKKRAPRKPKITTMTQVAMLIEVEKTKKYYMGLPAKLEAAIAERDAFEKNFRAACHSRDVEVGKREVDIEIQAGKIRELERERDNAIAHRDLSPRRIAQLEDDVFQMRKDRDKVAAQLDQLKEVVNKVEPELLFCDGDAIYFDSERLDAPPQPFPEKDKGRFRTWLAKQPSLGTLIRRLYGVK